MHANAPARQALVTRSLTPPSSKLTLTQGSILGGSTHHDLLPDELLDDLLAEEGEGEAAQGREVVGEHLVNEGEPLVE